MSSDSTDDSNGGMYWDGEDCPATFCSGTLEQQDQFNVMCLECRGVWAPMRDEDGPYLGTGGRAAEVDRGVE